MPSTESTINSSSLARFLSCWLNEVACAIRLVEPLEAVENLYSSFLQFQLLPDYESGQDGTPGAGLGVRETVLVIAKGIGRSEDL